MLPALLLTAALLPARAAEPPEAAAARAIEEDTAKVRPLAAEAVRLRAEAEALAAGYAAAEDLPALESRRKALREEARRIEAELRPLLRAQSERIYTAGTPMLVRAALAPEREGPRAFSKGFVAEAAARAALGGLGDSLALEDTRWREAYVEWARRRWWRRAALLAAGAALMTAGLAFLAYRRFFVSPGVDVIDARTPGGR